MSQYLDIRKEYLNNREDYSKEIQEIVDPYVVDPEEIDFYIELKKRGCTFDTESKNGADEVSFDDLVIFMTDFGPYEEHFNGIHDQIVTKGDKTFKKFVNYLADMGYIDNTSTAKQLFTYRLTGKCRPKQNELPKLHWNGKENNRDEELIYIIRYATDTTKIKYQKMREFFEGPNFHTDSPSSYADGALLDFRMKLHEFYDSVFPIKDKSSYRNK